VDPDVSKVFSVSFNKNCFVLEVWV
jgi:hypothetical protein